ncbi:MAG: sensor hybrid histidine kinase [Candidatus Saccharibacteria bacterium]|nr:sensor hybrid histidine kinase [Candidatus Saccharibacteria bacterium]
MDWLSRQLISHSAEIANEHRLFEKLILNLDGGVAYINQDMVYHLVNPVFAQMFGRKPEDFVGKRLFSVVPDARPQLGPIFQRVLKTGKPYTSKKFPLKYTDQGKSHVTYWDGTVTPVPGLDDKPGGLLILCFNITDSVLLQEERNRKAAIVEDSFDAIIATDMTGIITSWNPSAERVYGYSLDHAIGKSITITVPSDKTHELLDVLVKIKNGERVDFFITERLRQIGERFAVCLAVSPIRDSDRTVIGASNTIRDLSERLESLAPGVLAQLRSAKR